MKLTVQSNAGWFDDLGLRIAAGNTAKGGTIVNAFLSWEDVSNRIHELLRQGEYAPQAVLDAARQNALQEYAQTLAYMERDLADGVAEAVFQDTEIFRGGFQELTDRLAGLLDDTDFGEGFKGCRDRLIIEMFYATGMRLSELIGLDDKDVDFSASLLKVTGKRNKQRLIPFGDELRELMLEYINVRNETIPERSEAFFIRENGERLYKNLVYNLVKRNLSKVATLKKRSPHVLRHTFATTMLNNEAELGAVKELLGHESITTTEIYTHATFEELKKSV